MKCNDLEVLEFYNRRTKHQATVVTDGTHHALYTASGRAIYKKLTQAIAWLESHNYQICI